jgi:hypothetical protein
MWLQRIFTAENGLASRINDTIEWAVPLFICRFQKIQSDIEKVKTYESKLGIRNQKSEWRMRMKEAVLAYTHNRLDPYNLIELSLSQIILQWFPFLSEQRSSSDGSNDGGDPISKQTSFNVRFLPHLWEHSFSRAASIPWVRLSPTWENICVANLHRTNSTRC